MEELDLKERMRRRACLMGVRERERGESGEEAMLRAFQK